MCRCSTPLPCSDVDESMHRLESSKHGVSGLTESSRAGCTPQLGARTVHRHAGGAETRVGRSWCCSSLRGTPNRGKNAVCGALARPFLRVSCVCFAAIAPLTAGAALHSHQCSSSSSVPATQGKADTGVQPLSLCQNWPHVVCQSRCWRLQLAPSLPGHGPGGGPET